MSARIFFRSGKIHPLVRLIDIDSSKAQLKQFDIKIIRKVISVISCVYFTKYFEDLLASFLTAKNRIKESKIFSKFNQPFEMLLNFRTYNGAFAR